METIYQRVAGLDIHKMNVVVCLRKTSPDGSVEENIRTFATMTDDSIATCVTCSSESQSQSASRSSVIVANVRMFSSTE